MRCSCQPVSSTEYCADLKGSRRACGLCRESFDESGFDARHLLLGIPIEDLNEYLTVFD